MEHIFQMGTQICKCLPLVNNLYATPTLSRTAQKLPDLPLIVRTTTSSHYPAPLDSHSGDGCHSLETSWVPDHLVQGVDDLCETGPAIAVLLPTVQHELVQGSWAVHRRGQPVVLLNGVDDLYQDKRITVTRNCPTSYSLEY